MYATASTEISIHYLSWINERLREEVQKQQLLESHRKRELQAALSMRAKTALISVVSGLSLALCKWLPGS
jgi:hypothetical protein